MQTFGDAYLIYTCIIISSDCQISDRESMDRDCPDYFITHDLVKREVISSSSPVNTWELRWVEHRNLLLIYWSCNKISAVIGLIGLRKLLTFQTILCGFVPMASRVGATPIHAQWIILDISGGMILAKGAKFPWFNFRTGLHFVYTYKVWPSKCTKFWPVSIIMDNSRVCSLWYPRAAIATTTSQQWQLPMRLPSKHVLMQHHHYCRTQVYYYSVSLEFFCQWYWVETPIWEESVVKPTTD